jgi:transposase
VLSVPASIRIFLCREPVDFPKAHDGLVALVRSELGEDPLDGSLFVFLNRRRDRVKLLQWDGNGLWLHYKRLEQGTFRAVNEGPSIKRAQLAMLLEGIELKKGKITRRFADSICIRGDRSNDLDRHQRAATR